VGIAANIGISHAARVLVWHPICALTIETITINRRISMNVLVTGGTGVIGAGLIPALVREGHTVRLLSRGAAEDAREWPEGVEALAADVTDPDALDGACTGCDAVVHVTGIIEETPPAITFERVNVEGTRNIIAEAERAGVARFIFVSSLGADRGASDYHRSKLAAENAVREFNGDWIIVRPGNVYGPGDEVVSTLLKMVRTLPAVPVIDIGTQRFQPVWYEDLGVALARAVTMPELRGQILEITGAETITTNDVLTKLSEITDRRFITAPVPATLASIGTQIASMLGMTLPINESKLTMLLEENVIQDGGVNALTRVFGIVPTTIDDGLRRLADALPEQLPEEGFGDLERKRYWADIVGSGYDAAGLMEQFRLNVTDVMPIEFAAEPGAPTAVEKGATMTASLPMRGNIQIRVVESTETVVTFATIEGHPLAGVVRFSAMSLPDRLRFEVTVYARAANAFDWIVMKTVGAPMQDANWVAVVERVVEMSGGAKAGDVETEKTTVDDAENVEQWIRDLVTSAKREENAQSIDGA
jgi:uncharacterized protein YbjT (DUF2867 family)